MLDSTCRSTFRYKSFIPLMYVFWLVEWSVRAFLYPLTEKSVAVDGAYTSVYYPRSRGCSVCHNFISSILNPLLERKSKRKIRRNLD